MWKAPSRPNNIITQPLNDGTVQICDVVDISEPGYRPVQKLHPKVALRYENQRVGINRFYSGMQNQIQVDKVIRVPKALVITTQDVAVTEDGAEYRIRQVQDVLDVYPRCLDLTLSRIDQEDAYDMV